MQFKRTNFNIAFSGLMLSMVLIFQYIEKYMPLVPGLMNINITVVFVTIVFFATDWKFGLIVIFARFLVSPLIGEANFGLGVKYFEAFLSTLASLIFIGLLMTFYKLRLSDSKYAMYTGLAFVTIISAIIMALLNAVLFVPLWTMMAFNVPFTYELFPVWGMNGYFAVVFSVYFVGNVINFTLSSIVLGLWLKVFKKHITIN